MTDKREFKINLEAVEPEDDFKVSRPVRTPEVPKPVRYAPSLAVLFALMALGVTLVWMYFHFSARLEAVNFEGSSGIASLSSEFTDKITGMSQDLQNQKEAAQTLLANLENQIAKLKTSVSSLKTGKADTKDMDTAISGIKKSIAPLQGSLAQLEEQINSLDRKMENVSNSLQKIEQTVSGHTADIRKLGENRIDKNYIDQQLKQERQVHQQKLSDASESLLKEIASLETKLSNMKQRLVAMEKQLSKKSTVPERKPSSSSTSQPRPSTNSTSRPEPGEIIEQDIN